MHVNYVSAQTAERRRGKLEDVEKRKEYRKAHGLDTGAADGKGWLGWMGTADPPARDGAIRTGQAAEDVDASPVAHEAAAVEEEGADTFVDFEGKHQPVQKKWFGLW